MLFRLLGRKRLSARYWLEPEHKMMGQFPPFADPLLRDQWAHQYLWSPLLPSRLD